MIGLLAGLAVPASLAALAGFASAAVAQTTERVIVNRYTGLAIEGYDPVAYFADARAEPGRPEFEASEAGAVWRFRNEGNRASFVAHPEIYGPQFGGYDPIDLARGVTYAGNPRFWLVVGQRLYLFGREETPGCLCRRSGRRPAGRQGALAGAGTGAGPVSAVVIPGRCEASNPEFENPGSHLRCARIDDFRPPPPDRPRR